jgi:MYXO-CTERM domain-containing protein
MSRQFRLLPLLLALSAVSFGVQAAPVYTIAPIANLGATPSQPNGLNNAGTVVGYVYTPQSHINAYSSTNGNATSLHQGDPNTGNSAAYGINASGAVVGQSSVGNTTQATVFSNGSVRTLGTLGGTNSYGYGINASGQVVGLSDTGIGGVQHGFVTGTNGELIDIDPTHASRSSAASAINDLGQVTGYAETSANGDYAAYIYQNGAMNFLATLGGTYAQGYAINNAGMVAGYSGLSNGESHAFLYANGVLADLGDLGGNDSYATGINEAGDVVGVSNRAGGGSYHAFLYSGGTLKDLNDLIDPTLGWTLTYASDINDKGQIAAVGCKVGGCSSLLLSLADTGGGDPDPNAVPEPEAFTAGIAGLALFGLLRRRRAKR